MAVDVFLQFPKAAVPGNIQPTGDTVDAAFKGAVAVSGFTIGTENATTVGSASAGAGVGKARFKELVISRRVDKASGPLFQACCAGAHFPEVVLSVRRTASAGKPGSPYLVLRFSMVFCTNVDWAGPGDEGVEESVTFAYGAMQVVYQAMDSATGAMVGPAAMTSWSQVTNSPQYPVAGA